MKRIYIALFSLTAGIFLLNSACSGGGMSSLGNGELVGVKRSGKWKETTPTGMVYIDRGTMTIGASDQDPTGAIMPNRTVSIDAFWMDDTEITNAEYRQFIEWVRDSIARQLLGEQYPEFIITEDRSGNPLDPPQIDWTVRIRWTDPDYQMALQDMYIPENERFMGRKELDSRKLFYEFWWIDYQQAAQRRNSYNHQTQRYEGSVIDPQGNEIPVQNRSAFLFRDRVNVYPDTLVWIRDFTYSYNEPYATRYFWHPGFDEYPVVGVTWKQARAFANWRTKIQNDYQSRRGQPGFMEYRLPTETEWEYAARGNSKFSMYPWGGYYARDEQGHFLANFKPLRGNYVEDGHLATNQVGRYPSNDYGLYDMAGNVAEWTITAYDESGYMLINDLNPNYEYNALPDDPPVMKRKVTRGGSYKDVAYFLQVSTRSYEYQDTAKSYIGFRCVRSTFGNQF